jgi:hypothetical protein
MWLHEGRARVVLRREGEGGEAARLGRKSQPWLRLLVLVVKPLAEYRKEQPEGNAYEEQISDDGQDSADKINRHCTHQYDQCCNDFDMIRRHNMLLKPEFTEADIQVVADLL